MNNVLQLNSQQRYIDLLPEVGLLPTITSSPLSFVNHLGQLITDPDRKVITTTTSDEVINVVKNGFTFENNQPEDIVNMSEALLLQSGVSLKDLKREVQVAPNGSKMTVKYTLPDYTVDLGNGDETQFQILFYNSFDGTWSFTIRAGAIRMACLNNQVHANDISMFKAKHTPSINPDHARRKMVEAIQQFHAEGERWSRWKQQSVTNRQAFETFAVAAGCKFVVASPEMTVYELLENKQVFTNRNLMYMWNQYTKHEQKYLGSNEWAVYNALTHWSTHAPAGRKTNINNEMATTVRRQDSVRGAIVRRLAA